jgi:4-coumarate--CoA ligase
LFGLARMSKLLQKAIDISKKQVKIVYLKETSDEMIPAHSTYFNGLLDSYGIDYSSFKKNTRRCDDVALLPYSSGTTGKSKGVELTHRNVVHNMMAINQFKICEPTTKEHQEVLPCVLPMFHAYGLVIVLLCRLATGCQIVSLPKFTPDTFLNAMEKFKGTVLHLVPPIVIFLGHYDKIEKKHTESIKYIVSGAAPMGKTDVERLFARIPNTKFYQAYGLTEASPILTMNFAMTENHDTVGQLAALTEAKVCDVSDPTFKGLGPNQIGELLFRGPQIMKGYLHNAKATKETITEDGFLRTGDIGYYDENHDFFVTDRMKELIKVKGFQVPPAELEEILR